MNEKLLSALNRRPDLYQTEKYPFWDDEHISRSMLDAHLNPENDRATYRPEKVDSAVGWIASLADLSQGPAVLDLGCGPGVYTEKIAARGAQVTGMDISAHSIAYAEKSAREKGLSVRYRNENYLSLDETETCDVVMMVSCDFGVLPFSDRDALLGRIYRALRPGGILLFDAHSLCTRENDPESSDFYYSDGGFWSAKPHICLHSFLRFDECNTFVDRYVVAEKDEVRCYNIWNHRFSAKELENDLYAAGFSSVKVFSDITGRAYSSESETVCALARKNP